MRAEVLQLSFGDLADVKDFESLAMELSAAIARVAHGDLGNELTTRS